MVFATTTHSFLALGCDRCQPLQLFAHMRGLVIVSSFAMHRHKTFFLLSLLMILPSFVAVCRAQDAQIQPYPPDLKEVVVSGRPSNDATLIGHITLLSNKAVPELIFRSTDLQREGGTETVPRSQIQPVASGKLALPENTLQDFDFKVSGLKLPGTYTGSIDFFLPQHGTSAAIHLNLKVQVEQTPQIFLRKESQAVKIQIMNCSLLDCALSKWLSWNLTENYSITVDNGSSLPFKIDGATSAVLFDRLLQNQWGGFGK